MKKLGAVLLAVALVFNMAAVVSADTPTGKEIPLITYADNMTSYTSPTTSNVSATGWYAYSGAINDGSFSAADNGGDKAFQIKIPDGAAQAGNAFAMYSLTNAYSAALTGTNIGVEFKVRFDGDWSGRFYLLNTNNTSVQDRSAASKTVDSNVLFSASGFRMTPMTSAGAEITPRPDYAPIKKNEWAIVRYEINTTNETYSIYINDALHLSNQALPFKGDTSHKNDIQRICIQPASTVRTGIQVDDVVVYNLDSSDKNYWGNITVPSGTLEYKQGVDTLKDIKLDVPVLDKDGVATAHTISTPVRIAKYADASSTYCFAAVDGTESEVPVYIIPQVQDSEAIDSNNTFDDTTGLTLNDNIKQESEGEAPNVNKYISIKGADTTRFSVKGEAFASGKTLPAKYRTKISFDIRFTNIESYTYSSNKFFQIQLLNGNNEIALFILDPKTSVSRYSVNGATNKKQILASNTSGSIPLINSNTDGWNHFEIIIYDDSKLEVNFNNVPGYFNDTNVKAFTAPLVQGSEIKEIKFAQMGTPANAVVDIDNVHVEREATTKNADTFLLGSPKISDGKFALPVAKIGSPANAKVILAVNNDGVYTVKSFDASATENIDSGIAVASGNMAKSFIWESFETLKPTIAASDVFTVPIAE